MSRDPFDDLTAALSVEPSASFVANVRQRVARESIVSRSWTMWVIPAGATAMVGIAVWFGATASRLHPVLLTGTPLQIAVDRLPANPETTFSVLIDSQARSSRSRTAGRPSPEVIVSREQAEALQLIALSVEDGRFDSGVLLTSTPDNDSTDVDRAPIAPLRIERLTPLAALTDRIGDKP